MCIGSDHRVDTAAVSPHPELGDRHTAAGVQCSRLLHVGVLVMTSTCQDDQPWSHHGATVIT